MAVTKSGKGKIPPAEQVSAAALASITELLHDHMGGALELLDESEGGIVTVRVPIKIDCTESAPQVTVDIGYTKSVRDRRVKQLDDPDQGTFHEVLNGNASEPRLDEESGDGIEPVASKTTTIEGGAGETGKAKAAKAKKPRAKKK